MRIIKLSQSVASHFMILNEGGMEGLLRRRVGKRGGKAGVSIVPRTHDFICLLLYFVLSASRK